MHDINRLPLSQIKLLLRFWNNPNKIGFAEGREEGGSVKELNKKGLIEPAGKIGRRVRWRLVTGKLNSRDIDVMIGLIKHSPIPAEEESLIVELIGEAKDLAILISRNIGTKGYHYFLQSFFLVLRQMGYFFTEHSSTIFHYSSALSQAEVEILEKIRDIRDAIGHRESRKNFLTANIKLVGGMFFKNNDVEIQYGRNKIYLVGEILAIHKKMRKLFSSADELAFLSRSYGWQYDEKELREAEKQLIEKLKNPKALINLE
ncbi:MAG: hypothetical protein HYW63_00860 [Candidatus Levybacteria bacterium]|nr:hypothetical protein [Candidatus Levybacteria bacterium]